MKPKLLVTSFRIKFERFPFILFDSVYRIVVSYSKYLFRTLTSASTQDQCHAVATVKRKGMILPFQPLSLAFHNVNYYVDMHAVCSLGHHIPNLKYYIPKYIDI